jgi:quaternary ammonium compound-resistance protein SugE
MKFSDLKTLRFVTFYRWDGGLPAILPFVGYIGFGVLNIWLFSMAIKQIPTAIAFAVWTATTLIFLKIVDLTYFRQSISLPEVLFILMIMIGIIGLRIYAAPQNN